MTSYPNYNYQQPYQPQNMLRPVTCKEEAMAAQVDFMGGITVMPDLAHGVIYTKVFDRNTGNAAFAEYRLTVPEPPAPPVAYAPLDVVEQLQKELADLKALISRKKEAKE